MSNIFEFTNHALLDLEIQKLFIFEPRSSGFENPEVIYFRIYKSEKAESEKAESEKAESEKAKTEKAAIILSLAFLRRKAPLSIP